MGGRLALGEREMAALEAHYRVLLQWNRKMNLTTVTRLEEAAIRHYCESLFVGLYVQEGAVVDIGTGPGFPGIPLAIARPACSVDLVEAHQRKAVFLREAARGLGNVRVQAARAESVRGSFDWLVSRAVDPRDLMKLRIARRFALLIGAEDASAVSAEELVPLPWGDRRVLALGSF